MEIAANKGGGQLSQWYQAIRADDRRLFWNALDKGEPLPARDLSFRFSYDGCGVESEFGSLLGGLFGVGMRERAQDVAYFMRKVIAREPMYQYCINLIGFSRGGVTALLTLKALSASFATPHCKVNVLAVDPVPGVPLFLTNTGAALESWRVMRELFPIGPVAGGVRRAIYFDQQLRFHTPVGVPGDWDVKVLSGCHARPMGRIDASSPDLAERMQPAEIFYQFVSESAIPRVDFSALTPRGAGEELLSLPDYFSKKQAEFIGHITSLVNKNEYRMDAGRVKSIMDHDLSVNCFSPALLGGIKINRLFSTDTRQRGNDSDMPVIELAQSLVFMRRLMRHLPLQRSRDAASSKLAVYRMLSDSLDKFSESAVSASMLYGWFSSLVVLCVQPRKKQKPTHNGLALLAALHQVNQTRSRFQSLLRFVLGNYRNTFINYAMLLRHGANALVSWLNKLDEPFSEEYFPLNPRKSGVNLLLSLDRVDDNLAMVSHAIAQIGK
jgi:hypothetical protein